MEHMLKKSCLVSWPELNYNENKDSFTLVHMISQMLGKVKLALSSHVNHWWHVTLHLTPYGLTTGLLHYKKLSFEIRMDLLDHAVIIETSDGEHAEIKLKSMSVADFYNQFFKKLSDFGIHLKVWSVPVEVENPIRFEKDTQVKKYNPDVIENFVWVNNDTANVLEEIRSLFTGKMSQVHFFWGSFDLSVAFFSGNKAPDHPGMPNLKRSVLLEAYSHEMCSMGFWPGNGFTEPAFFSFIYPEPKGFKKFEIRPDEASYSEKMGEYILPYSAVERSGSDEKLKQFFASSLDSAFKLADFNENLLRRK